jgi:hypothetical protein
MRFVKMSTAMALAALAISLTSCATPRPPQVFHSTDSSALIVQSLDEKTCQMLEPSSSVKGDNDTVLAKAMTLSQHETAVVILENYTEPRIGRQYRERSTPWFVRLRGLGYQHIVFLRGSGVADPEGLITLVEYD